MPNKNTQIHALRKEIAESRQDEIDRAERKAIQTDFGEANAKYPDNPEMITIRKENLSVTRYMTKEEISTRDNAITISAWIVEKGIRTRKNVKMYLGPYKNRIFDTEDEARRAIVHLNNERARQGLTPVDYLIENGNQRNRLEKLFAKNGYKCVTCGKELIKSENKWVHKIAPKHRNLHIASPSFQVFDGWEVFEGPK